MNDVAPLKMTGGEPAAIHMVDPADLAALRLHQQARQKLGREHSEEWLADYLPIVERMLRRAGLNDEDCAPLREIAEKLRKADTVEKSVDESWSDTYARASAEISYLVLIGTAEDQAAQRVARALLARGVPLPSRGGDARGWKRLLEFREDIRNGDARPPIAEIYGEALAELKAGEK